MNPIKLARLGFIYRCDCMLRIVFHHLWLFSLPRSHSSQPVDSQMARGSPHVQASGWLGSPIEIQDQILEFHFFGSYLADLPVCYRPNQLKRKNHNVLRVNRQLYQEASEVLTRGAVLHLRFQVDDRDPVACKLGKGMTCTKDVGRSPRPT